MKRSSKYKLHKVKKQWVTIAVSMAALGSIVAGSTTVKASENTSTDTNSVGTTATDSATTTTSSSTDTVASSTQEAKETTDVSTTTVEAVTATNSNQAKEAIAETTATTTEDTTVKSEMNSVAAIATVSNNDGKIQVIDGKTYFVNEDGSYKKNFAYTNSQGEILYFDNITGELTNSNEKKYQEGISSLNNTYTEHNQVYNTTTNSVETLDSYLLADSWYRPKDILNNGDVWLPSKEEDLRPLLMTWWPDKQTQINYVNYMNEAGLGNGKVSTTTSQEDLNSASQAIQANIEKKIFVEGTSWLRQTITNFVKTQDNWNSKSESETTGKDKDHLQGGALLFTNSDKTTGANSNYRILNDTATAVVNNGKITKLLGSKETAALKNKFKDNSNGGYDFLLANDIDNSNPTVQAEQLNWLHFIMNFGSIIANDPTANFDGVRVDAVDNVDADLLQVASDYFKAKYKVDSSEANSINHLSILEAWSDNDPYFNESVKGAQLPIDNLNRLSLLYSLMRPKDERTPSLWPLIGNSLNNRSSDIDPSTGVAYKDSERLANYVFVRAHDSEVQTVIAKIINEHFNPTTDGLTDISLEEIEKAFEIYNADMNSADKKYTQFNIPSAYAMMLTNKDTITRVYYGDMYTDNGQYMAKKSPYYDALESLMKARIKYSAGGQDMALNYLAGTAKMGTYTDELDKSTGILTSVRYGKGANSATDLGTEETRTQGLAVIVSNNPKLDLYEGHSGFPNTLKINMGAAHKNQAYRPLMLTSKDGLDIYNTDAEAANLVLYTDSEGILTINPTMIKGYANTQVNGYLAVWVPVGATENQDARTAASTEQKTNGKVYESSAALDSQLIFEGFSNFQDFVKNDSQYTNKLIAQNADLFKSWGVTSFEMAPQYVSSDDTSFLDSIIKNGYAFDDRYDLAMSKNNKYGSLTDLMDALRALHKAGIQAIADWVPDQIYNLPGDEVVSATRTNSNGLYRSGSKIKDLLYVAKTKTKNDYQSIYGGAFLDELAKEYPSVFERVQISSGKKIDPTTKITEWKAEYFNGTSILGRGAYYVLKDWGSDEYFKVTEGQVILPKQLLGQKAITGFGQDNKGVYYYSTSGSRAVSAFVQDENGNTYYFDANGYMVTGFQDIKGSVYYFLPNGVQLQGAMLINNNGQYFYFNEIGQQYRDNYYLFNEKNWRYFDKDGVMARGITSVRGELQLFDNDGFQLKGVSRRDENGNLYYFDSGSGNAVKNRYFEVSKGSWAYAGTDGVALTGAQIINGKHVFFANDGIQIKGDFAVDNNGVKRYYDADSGEAKVSKFFSPTGEVWYYADSEGKVVTGIQTINGSKYYFNQDGNQAKNTFFTPDGTTWYYADSEGKLVTGLQTINKKIYYFNTDGSQVKGKFIKDSKSKQSYFDADSGELKVSTYFTPDGSTWYYAGSDGKVVTGQQNIDSQDLFFNADGSQVKGGFITDITGKKYYYDADSGVMKRSTFFTDKNDKWYYADSTGNILVGLQVISGKTYYFNTDGSQVKGEIVKDSEGNYRYFDINSGELIKATFFSKGEGKWYYANSKGILVKGQQVINGKNLYFREDGSQVKGELIETSNGTFNYYHQDSGELVKGLVVQMPNGRYVSTDLTGNARLLTSN